MKFVLWEVINVLGSSKKLGSYIKLEVIDENFEQLFLKRLLEKKLIEQKLIGLIPYFGALFINKPCLFMSWKMHPNQLNKQQFLVDW